MIRAIFFDFYGVWLPDIFADYLAEAEQLGPQVSDGLVSIVNQYFHGQADIGAVAGSFRYKMNRPDIDVSQFQLDEQRVSAAIVGFMRELHEHFLKLGILANLGTQEYQLLNNFNNTNQVLEVIGGPLPFNSGAPLFSEEIFVQALQAIGEPPANCLVVTGNPIYQSFAAGVGMTVVPFQGLARLRQDLGQMLSADSSA